MTPVAHAHQDRTRFKALRLHLEDVPAPRRRVCVGEHQHIGLPQHTRVQELALAKARVQRDIKMHFPFVDETAWFDVEDLQGGAHARRPVTYSKVC